VRKSPDLEAFWNALPNVELNDGVLQLPQGIYWLGIEENGSTLMVREVYHQLLEMADTLLHTGCKKLVVRGTPGTGKSWWLMFLLWEAARRGTTVVLQHAALHARFKFSADSVLKGHHMEGFQDELDDASVWYLVDGEAPTLIKARTFAALTPKKAHYWEYQKAMKVQSALHACLDLDELLAARKVMYSHLPEALVTELFGKWGGVARLLPAVGRRPHETACVIRRHQGNQPDHAAARRRLPGHFA
jgi:hypothetical protein